MCWPIWRRNRHLGPEVVCEYLDGRLSGKDVRRVEAHIEACPNCRREVESLRQTVLAVRRMPMRQPRRSFVFSAPPVASPAPSRPEPAPQAGLGAAAAIARPRIPRWAFGAVASACAVAFAVVLSLDLTGFFVAAPSVEEQGRNLYATGTDSSAPMATTTPIPAPSATPVPEGALTEPPRFGVAVEGPDDKSAFDQSLLTEDARAASQGGVDIDAEQGTWWVWHLAEGLLGGMALVAVMVILLRRRIPILGR